MTSPKNTELEKDNRESPRQKSMHNEWVKEKDPLTQLRNKNLKSRRTRSQGTRGAQGESPIISNAAENQ